MNILDTNFNPLRGPLPGVYVQYDPWGRMGNRMFQYAFGAILSHRRNCMLYHGELPNFGITANQGTPDREKSTHTKSYGNHRADLNQLTADPNNIIVDSFLQRAEYYLPYRTDLRLIFKQNPLGSINKDKLVIHIRETDYLQIDSFLGYKAYRNIIDESKFTDIIIVTDNSDCDTVKRLVSEGCTLNTPGYVDKFTHTSDERGMQDFRTLLLSENIALSQSSFSWWAAFLGNHKKVIYPFVSKSTGCIWKNEPGIDDVSLFYESPENVKHIL